MTIDGPGADLLAISANYSGRPLQNQSDGLYLYGLTIREGGFAFDGVGGGILNEGVMTITDSVIRDNEILGHFADYSLACFRHRTTVSLIKIVP